MHFVLNNDFTLLSILRFDTVLWRPLERPFYTHQTQGTRLNTTSTNTIQVRTIQVCGVWIIHPLFIDLLHLLPLYRWSWLFLLCWSLEISSQTPHELLSQILVHLSIVVTKGIKRLLSDWMTVIATPTSITRSLRSCSVHGPILVRVNRRDRIALTPLEMAGVRKKRVWQWPIDY